MFKRSFFSTVPVTAQTIASFSSHRKRARWAPPIFQMHQHAPPVSTMLVVSQPYCCLSSFRLSDATVRFYTLANWEHISEPGPVAFDLVGFLVWSYKVTKMHSESLVWAHRKRFLGKCKRVISFPDAMIRNGKLVWKLGCSAYAMVSAKFIRWVQEIRWAVPSNRV